MYLVMYLSYMYIPGSDTYLGRYGEVGTYAATPLFLFSGLRSQVAGPPGSLDKRFKRDTEGWSLDKGDKQLPTDPSAREMLLHRNAPRIYVYIYSLR